MNTRRSGTKPQLRQAFESRLGEMFVEGQRLLDPPAFHHHKRHAVRKGIALVGIVGEIAPGFRKHRFIDMHEGDQSLSAVQVGIVMLRAVSHAGAHRMLSQTKKRIAFACGGLDQDSAPILVNLDLLHPAQHAPRNQHSGAADDCFHGASPKLFMIDEQRSLVLRCENTKLARRRFE